MPPDRGACAACGRALDDATPSTGQGARPGDGDGYCSTACRDHGVGPADRLLEEQIRGLLDQRAEGATICISEAARGVAGGTDEDAWRALMEPARLAARRLVAAGEVVVTQRGSVVDPWTARGPIRVRRRRPG